MTIEEIKSNLTNNKDENVAYLRSLLEEHRKNNDVYQAIRELIFENLDEQTIKKYSTAMKDSQLFCKSKFDDIHKYINDFQYDKAEKVAFEIIDFMNVYLKTVNCTCLNFNGVIEFIFYINKYKPANSIEWATIDVSHAYFLLGHIAMERKEYDKALDYYNKSLEFNPVNTKSMFTKLTIYQLLKDEDNFNKELNNLYNNIIFPDDLARYYRTIGYKFVEEEKYNEGCCSYIYSLKYEKSDIAFNELNYIISKTGNLDINNIDVLGTLTKNNIPLMIPSENLVILHQLVSNEKLNGGMTNLINAVNNILNIFVNGVNDEDNKNE